MTYRTMTESDIHAVVPLYMEYYNTHDGDEWTAQTTYKRIHQIWSREDSLCLILEDGGNILGFCMGYFSQYYDLIAYDLMEILIFQRYQNQGIGTRFMQELERRVRENGGAMIQLQAVNDDMHNAFYGKLNYQNCSNLVLKSKFL